MSVSIGTNEARGAWNNLLQYLQSELEGICPLRNTVPNEAAFRDKFLALPKERHDREPDTNYAYFIRHHEQILFFTREIDQAVQLETPSSLNDLFWTVALVAIESAFEQEFDFEDFSEVYEDLNDGLPKDNSDLSLFPRHVQVQECLQAIFEAYIKCYLKLIAQVRTDDQEIDFTPVEEQIEEAKTVFEKQQAQWRDKCAFAQAEVQRLIQDTSGGEHNLDARFEHLRDLGRGSYGTVDQRKVKTQLRYKKGSEMRLKSCPKTQTNLHYLRHNHISSVNMLFRNEHYWSIIMLPVADCDLRVFLDERCVKAGYPHEAMRLLDSWFGCLISALTYAHDEQVKHEDIKPNNILIKGRKVYLTDFGTAKDFSEFEASTVGGYLEQGTPVYWAPEPRAWGRPADVFALGCVFAEMLTVRQHKTLVEFRKFRFSPGQDFGYAYRSNLPKVKRWLKDFLSINSRDPVAQTILEQTLNMLIGDHLSRPDARRIKKHLKVEEQLFCASCA